MTPADLDDLRTLYRQISRRHSVYEKFAPALERALRELEETPIVVQVPKYRAGAAAETVLPRSQQKAEVEIDPRDLRIDTYRPGGNGGWVNKPDTCVRITHLPTGLFAESENERSVHLNRAAAMKKLAEAVAEHLKK